MSAYYRYSRWDGSQHAFEIDEEALLEEFSESLLARGDVSAALRSLAQRGIQPKSGDNVKGVQDLLQQLRSQRQDLLSQHDLGSALQDIRRRLDEVLQTERDGIQRRLDEARQNAAAMQEAASRGETPPLDPNMAKSLADRLEEMARRKNETLNALPKDLGGAVRELNSYEFMEPEAQRLFDELKRMLQQEFVDRQFQQVKESLQRSNGGDMAATKEMLKDLNRMLDRYLQGQEAGFDQFMQRWGEAFGDERPQNLEELVSMLQQQAAQMQSLLDSLSPEQRHELQELMESLLQDPELQREMAALLQSLEALSPTGELGRRYPFHGDDPVTLQEALDLMDRLHQMDDLERQLKRSQQGGNLEQIDSDAVRELLGEESFESLEQLKHLTQRLEEAGYIRQVGENKYELTPRGIRRIGQKALGEIFAYLKRSHTGRHVTRERGHGGEPSDATKQYAFGDQFSLHMQRTIQNAIVRAGTGTPVRLEPRDFEVYQMEDLTQSSTVLMVDLSLSMAMRGNFLAAKKVALALDSLIRTQFNRDNLYIVGFSTYAREMKPERLAYLSWDEFDPYTNIQHGLALSQRLLSRHKGGTKQIIMISDGEPTAHMEGGQLFLQYPPSPRTIRETLREVRRVTQSGITINTFMLERNAYLMEFVDEMTRINKGRVFYTTSEHLGEYILVDYLTSKRRKFVA
jgi:uncharacterized protein with von Willebrand factor type A (vWA) domain